MSQILGGQVMPQVQPSLVGHDTQNNFLTALFGQGLKANPTDGGMEFAGVTPYSGQLTPNVNNTILPQVYGAYNPATAGAPLYSMLQSTNPSLTSGVNSVPGMMSDIQQYGGMNGWPTTLMHNMAQFGTTGYNNYLTPYMGARPYSSRG